QGTKLLDFVSTHNGMGSFELVPSKDENYTATWKDAMGKEYSTPLPAVQEEGVTLRIKGSDAGQTFTVTRSATADEASKTLRIVAVMNQRMLYSAKANLTDVVAKSGMLPTAELPSGIMQITVLDANLKPLAERVVFINNREYEFDADVYLGVKNLEKRGLNKGEVIIADTMLSNLSLSVTDADLNAVPQYEDNIVSRFLLTGDLRGKIVNPYYYFFSTSDSANIHLNLVMLTHGWRRYNWPELLAGKLPLRTKKESNFLSIEGQLLGGEQGKIPPGTMLTGIIQAKDSTRTFISLPVDRFGRVKSDGMIFYDYAKLFFQFADTKRKFETSSLNVDNGLYKGMKSISFSAIDKMRIGGPDSTIWARNLKQASDEVKIAIQRNRKTQTLQEVIVKGKVKTEAQKMDERYTSGLFSGGDARSFDVANDPFGATSFSVFQYLQGKVAGLQISMAGGQPSLSWRGSSPVFYLNEMQSDVSLIQNINMSEVAYIKVFGPGAAGGMQTQGGGAIAVYTKKGGDVTDNSDAKGLSSLQITGYTDLKEFSSPDYATAAPTHDLPDLRTTLFWNPFIFLDKASRRYKFQFYNSDATKRFRLVLEGINIEGKFVHIEKLIQ
ncbi:MAG: hypothetical protein H7Y27_00275, partial [Gemmatimonadaceae bacterium]|nr:hypothetical protein [Chitinophagaceae bacterium]